jgi:transcriptional regulator with XRE-family HTH domain
VRCVRDDLIGRVLRALRHRKGWRQQDLSWEAGVARSVISDFEAGVLDRHTVGALRSCVSAAGGYLRLTIDVPRGDLDRLLDADHARLQERWKRWLEARGWFVEAEVTFNHFGERGSIDLLAWHPTSRAVLVIEIKSVIVDVQATTSSIDRKTRIARVIARDRGWQAAVVIPALLVREGSTARRRVASHTSIFARFALRGRAALAWLRDPTTPAPSGLLCFTELSDAPSGDARRAGRQRVRSRKARARSADARPDAAEASESA